MAIVESQADCNKVVSDMVSKGKTEFSILTLDYDNVFDYMRVAFDNVRQPFEMGGVPFRKGEIEYKVNIKEGTYVVGNVADIKKVLDTHINNLEGITLWYYSNSITESNATENNAKEIINNLLYKTGYDVEVGWIVSVDP